jgi:hypothetical protein
MKKVLLTVCVALAGQLVFGQNINDHKVSFKYIQLPLVKVDDKFTKYEVNVEHGYEQANEDSTSMFEIRRQAALDVFHSMMKNYQSSRDSLDRIHLRNLAAWEKKVNSGATNPDGTAIAKPNPPIYPAPPSYPSTESPQLHSAFVADNINDQMKLAGYEQGGGEIVITLNILPIRNISITETKKGTGASTKYEYYAKYVLPIGVKVESPTQGPLLDLELFTNVKSYKMKDQKSQYDHALYMMDNKEAFFAELEAYARRSALNAANDYINNQFGFVEKSRTAEIYSVKKFKNYDYSDVTNAFTLATFALQEVKNDRDRSGAADKIEEAIDAIKGILEEASTSDNKARINPKVTAMLQCNLAELYIWLGEFDKADATVNIAMNSGEGKAKRHCKGELGFYADQRKRWEVHY